MAVMPPPTSLRCEHSPDSPVIIYKPKEGFETGTFPTIFQDDDVFKHPIMSSTTNTTSSLHEDEVSEIWGHLMISMIYNHLGKVLGIFEAIEAIRGRDIIGCNEYQYYTRQGKI